MHFFCNSVLRFYPSGSHFPQPYSLAQTMGIGLPLSLLLFAVQSQLALGLQQTPDESPQNSVVSKSVEEFREIPTPSVTKIILYSSGVAQVIHSGEVDGSIKAELRFGGHDVDDALKSLILEDPQGLSHIVKYPTAPDKEQIAANDFETPLTLAQTLQQFRGEPIEFLLRDERHTGKIMGVENRVKDRDLIETLVILGESGLKAFPIPEMTEVQFLNQPTATQFNDAMAGLVKKRDPSNKKRVYLQFAGTGKRKIRFSYLVDAPIWRITYRLMLEKDRASLQSWVHLDNVFGYDWKDVEIELRNGRPDVFHADLFAPIVAERPNVGLSVFDIPSDVTIVTQWFGMEPPVRFGGLSGQQDSTEYANRNMGGGGGGQGGLGGGGGFGGGGGNGLGGVPAQNRDRPGLGAATDGDAIRQKPLDPRKVNLAGETQEESGEAIVIQLKQRVSLPSGNSAVVPIFQKDLPATRVAYVSHVSGKSAKSNAVSQIELTNDGETPLLTGPVAIFEQGAFVGDGKVSRTVSKEKILIDYGDDLETLVESTLGTRKVKITRLSLVNGYIQIDHQESMDVVVDIINHHQDPRTVRLNLGGLSGWTKTEPELKLVNDQTTLSFEIPPRSNQHESYRFIKDDFETKTLPSAVLDESTWKEVGVEIPAEIRELIRRFKDLRDQLRSVEAEQSTQRNQLEFLKGEQTRWGGILGGIKEDPESLKTYAKFINQAELEIAEVRKRMVALENDAIRLNSELNQLTNHPSPKRP